MIVLICGSRDWSDRELIEAQIFKLSHGSCIVHGEQRGADMIADAIARDLLYDVKVWPVSEHAGSACDQALGVEQPDEVWAFHDSLEFSDGTKYLVNRALEQGYPVKVFSHENPMGKTLPIRLSLW
jgi:hypothetical protein